MITLHKFIPAWGLPDISVFCIKVETYLRMTGMEYQSVVSDSRKAPKGKCPYIEHQGTTICDSSMIVDYLEMRSSQPLDAGMSTADKAVATAFKSLFEEHLYFVVLWLRWVDGWATYRPVIFSLAKPLGIPRIALPLVAWKVRRDARRALWLQGTGRHTPEQINDIGMRLLSAASIYLGTKPYFLGEHPRTIDATVYGFLASLIWAPFEGPLKEHALKLENLVTYCERMKARYWAEA